MATQIQVRRDITANWSSQVLAEGEIGLELDAAIADGSKVNGIKIGDGTTAWSALEYASLVFEHANTVVDGDNNTLYIKGKGSQSGKLVLVEGSDADVLLSIADDGTILFNEAGSGQVDFGGGSNSTGVTIQANGDIEMSAASRLEMGSTVAGSTSAGSGVEMTTETNYGRVHLKANSSANDTDDMITVTKNTTANFVVEADGDVACTGVTASDNITAAAGKKIEAGTYTSDGSDSGVKIEDNTDHGRILISAASGSSAADPVIQCRDDSGNIKFEVERDGGLLTQGQPSNLGGIIHGVGASGNMLVGDIRAFHATSGTTLTTDQAEISSSGSGNAGVYMVLCWSMDSNSNNNTLTDSSNTLYTYDGSGNENVKTGHSAHSKWGFVLRIS
tara:strand:+ start:7329 stop:8498 length:1170 start_codon:yes stop_codon:yes gene_type:complete